MGRGVNKVILVGHCGKDPELRNTASGTSVLNMSLATSERRKGSTGDWEDFTEWHSLVMFGRTAEAANEYLRKGSQIYVEGVLRTREWQREQDTHTQRTTEIIVNNMVMLGSGSGRTQNRSSDRQNEYSSPSEGNFSQPAATEQPINHQSVPESKSYDEDLPF